MRRWLLVPALVAGVGMFAGCANDEAGVGAEGVYEEGVGEGIGEGVGTAGVGYGYAEIDRDVGTFLTDYYRQNEMFADDNLQFGVNQGVVTITGTVDTAEERANLVRWVNAVPGVRSVVDTGLGVAE